MANDHDHDQNLLFGLLALQMDFIRREELLQAVSTWRSDKSRRLEEILVEQGLAEEDRQLLAPLVARHLENHDGDPRRSLAALSSIGSVAEELRKLGDAQIEATLSFVGSNDPKGEDTATVAHHAAASIEVTAAGEHPQGRFRILRSHAKGGLGEVYVAMDTELHREVALKEIQGKFAHDENSRSRFLLEAEVTGGLEHPGIVPVYGLGRYEDGRPFYAMRFIKGDSLQEAADRFHRPLRTGSEAGRDSEADAPAFDSLEFRKLLGRFIDVCQAIEYAHSRGVLHRDLKPGNIMLGKYGETLVVDWGLAKTQGHRAGDQTKSELALQPASASGSAPTLMGSAIGTPAFMPPEQAAGDLDRLGPASDVYSLGATLYYLLTGRPPFAGKDLRQVLEEVKAGTFLPPRVVQPLVPKALEAICLRAMALQENDRYVSPQQIAEDAERFLADEPVSVLQEALLVKARRWIRKHRTLTTATAAVVLVSLVGLSVFSAIVSKQNRALTVANQRETEARALAVKNEASARQQSRLALTTLTSVIGDMEKGFRNLSGSGEVRRRLLRTSLAKLKEITSEYVEQAAIDRQTLIALAGMGDVILELGADEISQELSAANSAASGSQETSAVQLAETLYRRSFEIATLLAGNNPDSDEAQRDLALLYERIGTIEIRAGNPEAAREAYQKSLELRASLVAKDPSTPQSQHDLAISYQNVGDIELHLGNARVAMTAYQDSLKIREQLAADHPEKGDALMALAVSHERLGDLQLRMGNPTAALASYQQSGQALKSFASQDPQNANAQRALAISLEKLGDVQLWNRNPSASLGSYQESLEIFAKLAAEDPQNITTRRALGISYGKLGDTQLQLDNPDRALTHYRNGHRILEKLATEDPLNAEAQIDWAASFQKLADVVQEQGNTAAAEAGYQRSAEIYQQSLTKDSQNIFAQHGMAVAYGKLGDLQSQSGNSAAALDAFQRSREVLEQIAAHDPLNAAAQYDLALAHSRVGNTHVALSEAPAARAAYQRSLEIFAKLAATSPEDPDVASQLIQIHYRLAETEQSAGDHASAVTHYEAAAGILADLISKGQNVEQLRQQLEVTKQAAETARLADVALGDWETLLEQPNEVLPALLDRRAIEFTEQSRFAEAAQAAKKLSQLETAGAGQLYNAACVFSRCVASIRPPDEGPLTREQQARRDAWTADALLSLQQAVDAGWDDFAQLLADEDLQVIRERPEFQSLIPAAPVPESN